MLVDSSELAALGVTMGKLGFRMTLEMVPAFELGANQLKKRWASNARATSGVHGKHYPDSIDYERKISTDIVFEVGPNPNKPQGGMEFERGSVNQSPHLDGLHAADEELPHLGRNIQRALSNMGL